MVKNPSRWSRRLVIASVAFVGMCAAFYLGAFQLNLVHSVWDPLFGKQDEVVLFSPVSRWIWSHFFFPDAILGGLAYLVDIVFALIFSDQRWKKQPWVVILFGINVYPVGLVSLILVALQATVVKAWCALCLLSAGVSICLMFLAYEEIAASVQHLKKVAKKAKSHKAVLLAFFGKGKL